MYWRQGLGVHAGQRRRYRDDEDRGVVVGSPDASEPGLAMMSARGSRTPSSWARSDRGPRLVAEPGRDDDLDLDEQVAGRRHGGPATAGPAGPGRWGAGGGTLTVSPLSGGLDGGAEGWPRRRSRAGRG